MKNNQKGFTLVELIVVVAILGIVGSLSTMLLPYVFTQRAREAASDFQALLSQCRVSTLGGAQNPYVTLTLVADDGYYATLYEDNDVVDATRLGNTQLACSFTADGVSYSISDSQPLVLGFDRVTGSFLDLDEAAARSTFTWTGPSTCTAVTMALGSGSYTVTLVPATGYHWL